MSRHERIAADLWRIIDRLAVGWSEKIEYAVRVGGQVEKRAGWVSHKSLIVQLERQTDRLITGERCESSGGKPTSRPPGNLEALALLEEIHTYALEVGAHWDIRRPPRTPWGTRAVLGAIAAHARTHTDDELSQVAWHLQGYARRAQTLLGHEAPIKLLADSVCGECGGALAVPSDARGAVRCVGSPQAPPCGTRYQHSRWLELALERQAER